MQEYKSKEEYTEEADFEYKESGGWKYKFWDFIGGRYFVPIIIVLIAVIAFSMGKISGINENRPEVKIIDAPQTNPVSASVNKLQNTAAAAVANQSGQVVASRSGTKYHYPWCAGAKQIATKNLITFNSIEEARAAGYTPASNCKGLK